MGMRRPAPATAISLVSLFIALGSTAYAVSEVKSRQIEDGSIRAKDIGARQINAELLAPNAIQGTLGEVAVRSGLGHFGLNNPPMSGCAADEQVLGGGYAAAESDPSVHVYSLHPLGGIGGNAEPGERPTGWSTFGWSPGFVRAYSICAKVL